MTLIHIDQNNLASVYFDEDNQIIIYKTESILANQNIDKIQSLLEQCMQLPDDQITIGEIVDLTNLRGNFKKIIDFLINTYYPVMHRRGMKKAAYVISNDLLSYSLVQDICDKNELVETKAFYDMFQAEKWVLS